VNAMLGEEELARLMAEAADSYEVPEPPSYEKQDPAERTPVWRRPWLQGAAAVAVVAIGLATFSNGAGRGASDSAGPALREPTTAGQGTDSGALGGGTTGAAAPVPAGRGPQVPGSGGVQPGSSTGADARVVKTGEISLVVDEGRVSATVARLQSLVSGLRGFVADSTSNEAAEHPSATMTVRVPVQSFETLIRQVRGLQAKVVSQTSTGKDVTASYADTQAQIATLKAARERYLSILARARTIAETLSVQQRIDDVQGQIDRLEGQRRVLADQSDYGTLTVSVAEDGDEAKAYSEPSGWSKAWDDAKDGFTGGIQWLIAGSGRALLLLLCAAALVALGRVGWRVLRRRMV
jgi:hypothetical protein